MKKLVALCFCLPLILSAGYAHAQDELAMRSTFFVGAGTAEADEPFENDGTPFVIGFTNQAADSRLVWGFDIAGEGTFLDSTWGQDETPSQALSANFLIGTNVIDGGRFKADVALLGGIRLASADRPDSYLGFQCYADAAPSTEYAGNYGGLVAMSFDRLTLGVRATGESTQVVAGFRF